MTKRKNPVVKVDRNGMYDEVLISRRGRKIAYLCYRQFARYTGLKLKPGECKAIRINVEVVK